VIMTKPLAHPHALGLAGFVISTWLLSSWYNNWWGAYYTVWFLPWVLTGGLMQLFAARHAIRARDNLALVAFGTWGAFYIATALLLFMAAIRRAPFDPDRYAQNHSAAFFLIPVGALTGMAMFAAIGRSVPTLLWLMLQFAGTICNFIGMIIGTKALIKVGMYLFFVAACIALYRLLCLLIETTWHRSAYVPTMRFPWESRKALVKVPIGEPGVSKGQY